MRVTPAPRIAGVALQWPDDPSDVCSMDAPARHHDLIQMSARLGMTPGMIAEATQGFMTDGGTFVDRIEGRRVAERAGQMIRRTHPTED